MKITVTQENISEGISEPHSCPIALAMSDAGIEDPGVSPLALVGKTNEGRNLHVTNPPDDKVTSFIKAFDRFGAGAVQPFEFELDWE
ncbi:hypothetical protein PBI_KAMPE_102 [Gordonia phage Kampe]|uniref:Uncharacterized protein n=3 Tax=Gordonia phage Orchid TaxID=1838075 RepID=A0A160DH92_9CAUD|nr:hypothetical protein BH761_gp112 [Gordonia phage Orchid]ANA87334.1 hypothetical protein PBI_PATRICKSTAR_102 [Gordonia phage PatrickStar]ANA87445.1 hypothetical protein PBI_ORCHID_101 [Gordonia phage Orchid]ANA87560.1 hypothetical protein PBI_KAMPE_102 [Gordonia phage Kampe]